MSPVVSSLRRLRKAVGQTFDNVFEKCGSSLATTILSKRNLSSACQSQDAISETGNSSFRVLHITEVACSALANIQ